ncbi:MAG: response regulator, partial [Gemmatimonadetes bacterium]|nr:response regulator [Gemmatimonadota bacterium]
MRILVIEDDPTVGEFVRRGLEEQRWQADLVANGLEGERLALSQPYDLVVLDMRLPGRNGLDVLRSLRARGMERPVLV